MSTVLVEARQGPIWVFERDLGCSKMIREYGEYSELELAIIKSFVSNDSVVLDIGAHIGAFTVPLAKLTKQVYAMEPQARVREVLEKNIELGGVSNVTILPFGVGFKREQRFYTPDPLGEGSVRMKATGTTEVDIHRLDDLGLEPNFIKIDSEGMELDILGGGMDIIQKCRPYIFAEYSEGVFQALTLLEYIVSPIHLPIFVPNNWKKNPVNHYPHMAHQMFLGVPKEK